MWIIFQSNDYVKYYSIENIMGIALVLIMLVAKHSSRNASVVLSANASVFW